LHHQLLEEKTRPSSPKKKGRFGGSGERSRAAGKRVNHLKQYLRARRKRNRQEGRESQKIARPDKTGVTWRGKEKSNEQETRKLVSSKSGKGTLFEEGEGRKSPEITEGSAAALGILIKERIQKRNGHREAGLPPSQRRKSGPSKTRRAILEGRSYERFKIEKNWGNRTWGEKIGQG